MIRKLVNSINYENYLRKTQQDWESRWENVQELITFASEVESDVTSATKNSLPEYPLNEAKETMGVAEEYGLFEFYSFALISVSNRRQSILRQFLQASMLSSEGDNQSEEEGKEVRSSFIR